MGDGSTTFNVPDCRGRTRVGVDTTALRLTGYTTPGAVGGAEGVTLTIAQLAAHTHADTGHTHGDSGHAHGFSDPGHNHGLVQSSHQHAPYPGGTGAGGNAGCGCTGGGTVMLAWGYNIDQTDWRASGDYNNAAGTGMWMQYRLCRHRDQLRRSGEHGRRRGASQRAAEHRVHHDDQDVARAP